MIFEKRAVHKKTRQVQVSPLTHKPSGPHAPPRSISQASEYIRAWSAYNEYWDYFLVVNGVIISTNEPYQRKFILEDNNELV